MVQQATSSRRLGRAWAAPPSPPPPPPRRRRRSRSSNTWRRPAAPGDYMAVTWRLHGDALRRPGGAGSSDNRHPTRRGVAAANAARSLPPPFSIPLRHPSPHPFRHHEGRAARLSAAHAHGGKAVLTPPTPSPCSCHPSRDRCAHARDRRPRSTSLPRPVRTLSVTRFRVSSSSSRWCCRCSRGDRVSNAPAIPSSSVRSSSVASRSCVAGPDVRVSDQQLDSGRVRLLRMRGAAWGEGRGEGRGAWGVGRGEGRGEGGARVGRSAR